MGHARSSRWMISGILSVARYWVPSWKFFVEVGPVPELLYRVSSDGIEFGPWTPCLEKQERRWHSLWYSLFLNSNGNLQLAFGNLIERLVRDISELSDEALDIAQERLTHSVTYRLVANLVRQKIRERHGSEKRHFQFKVRLSLPDSVDPITEDILVSLSHEV